MQENVRKTASLKWKPSQIATLSEAFSLLDQLLFELEKTRKHEEEREMLHPIVQQLSYILVGQTIQDILKEQEEIHM